MCLSHWSVFIPVGAGSWAVQVQDDVSVWVDFSELYKALNPYPDSQPVPVPNPL